MKLSKKCLVRLKPFITKKDLYEQLLTEIAEVVYDFIGPSKKFISTATGGCTTYSKSCNTNSTKGVKSG